MDIFMTFLILSIIAEYLTSIVKPLVPETDYPVPLVITLIFSIVIAVACKVDMLGMFGLTTDLPMLSYIISGLAAAGGSKATHELLNKLRESRESIMPNNTAE